MRVSRQLRIAGLCALCLIVGAPAVHEAQAQGARARLRSILSRQREVRGQLREIKQEQSEAATALSRARRQEQEARDAADSARSKLAKVRTVLRQVKADLKQTEEDLTEHRGAMSRRITALYQAGQPSYLEVVLNATSFEDFTNRAEFSRLIARQDQSLLTTFVETQNKLRAQRAELEAREREAAQLRTEAERQEAAAERHAAQARAVVAQLARDRATYEREMAGLEAAEEELAAIVAREGSRSGGGGGGYVGTSSGRYSLPVGGRITSRYGWRTHPVWGGRRFHTGVDISAPSGTPIRACDDGRVIRAGWMGATGLTVVIDHGDGWSTSYGHCSRIYVSSGQTVSAGQSIGAVGSTGVSTGPHVHWMVYRNGSHVNPLN